MKNYRDFPIDIVPILFPEPGEEDIIWLSPLDQFEIDNLITLDFVIFKNIIHGIIILIMFLLISNYIILITYLSMHFFKMFPVKIKSLINEIKKVKETLNKYYVLIYGKFIYFFYFHILSLNTITFIFCFFILRIFYLYLIGYTEY